VPIENGEWCRVIGWFAYSTIRCVNYGFFGANIYSRSSQSRSEGEQKRATKRLLRRQAQRKRKLAEMGINYDIDVAGYVSFSLSLHQCRADFVCSEKDRSLNIAVDSRECLFVLFMHKEVGRPVQSLHGQLSSVPFPYFVFLNTLSTILIRQPVRSAHERCPTTV